MTKRSKIFLAILILSILTACSSKPLPKEAIESENEENEEIVVEEIIISKEDILTDLKTKYPNFELYLTKELGDKIIILGREDHSFKTFEYKIKSEEEPKIETEEIPNDYIIAFDKNINDLKTYEEMTSIAKDNVGGGKIVSFENAESIEGSVTKYIVLVKDGDEYFDIQLDRDGNVVSYEKADEEFLKAYRDLDIDAQLIKAKKIAQFEKSGEVFLLKPIVSATSPIVEVGIEDSGERNYLEIDIIKNEIINIRH
ncbi:MAG: hypothetical protein Q4P29_05375 [Tissierellia bacterium]|nr:hypothetical protein [Tissierellia bacterium]